LSGIHFNLSHSGSEVWLALCRAGEIGIDVETSLPVWGDLEPWLHPAERSEITCQHSLRGLRRLWVRKEAIVKAVGLGLSLPLDDFQVGSGDGHDWLIQAPSVYPGPWRAFEIAISHDADIAVAVRADNVRMMCQRLSLRWNA
jgi:4'-phosphopantetheinyl transferase